MIYMNFFLEIQNGKINTVGEKYCDDEGNGLESSNKLRLYYKDVGRKISRVDS